MTELKESDLDANPIVQFERWFVEARENQSDRPESMTVATASADGTVSARVCLLKGFDQHGFVFFTNFESRKGRQLGQWEVGPLSGEKCDWSWHLQSSLGKS